MSNNSRNLAPSGGQFFGDSPSQHVHAGQLLQSAYIEQTTDVTTNSNAWVALFTYTLTRKSADSTLRFIFSASANGTNANSQLRFGLFIDGTLHRGCGCRAQGTYSQAATMTHQMLASELSDDISVPITVELKWEVSAGIGQIRPVSHPDDESASLIIDEILAQ